MTMIMIVEPLKMKNWKRDTSLKWLVLISLCSRSATVTYMADYPQQYKHIDVTWGCHHSIYWIQKHLQTLAQMPRFVIQDIKWILMNHFKTFFYLR